MISTSWPTLGAECVFRATLYLNRHPPATASMSAKGRDPTSSNYVTSQANYRRVIGVNPGRLDPGTPVDRLSPATLPRAITSGETQSPSVLAAAYGIDVAELAVK